MGEVRMKVKGALKPPSFVPYLLNYIMKRRLKRLLRNRINRMSENREFQKELLIIEIYYFSRPPKKRIPYE